MVHPPPAIVLQREDERFHPGWLGVALACLSWPAGQPGGWEQDRNGRSRPDHLIGNKRGWKCGWNLLAQTFRKALFYCVF